MKPTLRCRELYSASLGDNTQLNHSSMDRSLIFLQSYLNAECTLQDTASKQNKNWTLSHGARQAGCPATINNDQPCYDTECLSNDLDEEP